MGDARIRSVAKKHEKDFEIVIIAETNVRATDIEEELKKIGDNPGYSGDGATEFRAMSDEELQKALDIIERVQTSILTQLPLFSEI